MKKLASLLLLLAPLLALPGVIHQIGGYDADSFACRDICVQRSKAYVSDGGAIYPNGFAILDITVPVNPQLLGYASHLNRCYDIRVHNLRAYVAAGEDGVLVFDVSDPSAPAGITSLSMEGRCETLTIEGDRLYAIDSLHGLKIYDISGPNPQLLRAYDLYSANDILVCGDLAYVGANNPGLVILDVSDPTAIYELGSFDEDSITAKCLSKEGDLLYLTDKWQHHYLANAADPAEPYLLASLPDQYCGVGCIYENHLFVDVWTGVGLNRVMKVFDLADPTQPALIATCSLPGAVFSLYPMGDRLYVTPETGDLMIFDISDFSNPALITTSHIPASAIAVKLRNDYAYIADSDSRLIQLDVSEPANPRLVSQYPLPHPFMDLELAGDLAFVSTGDFQLRIFQLGEDDPPTGSNFHLLASLPTGNYPRDLCVDGNTVFIANEGNLLSVNVTDPADPQIVSAFPAPDLFNCELVAKYQNHLYVASWGMPLMIIDVSDIHNPTLVGTLGTAAVTASLEVSGHYLYQTGYSLPVLIYDLSDPAQPVYLGALPDPSSDQPLLFREGDFLFVSFLGTNNIKGYSLDNPAWPGLIWNYQWSLPAWDLAYREGLLYVCGKESGFCILNTNLFTAGNDPQAVPAPAFDFSCYPNPTAGSAQFSYKAETPHQAGLTVFNLRGQAVRHLTTGPGRAGLNTIAWDGADDLGRRVSAGIYLVRLQACGQTAFRKIVRLN